MVDDEEGRRVHISPEIGNNWRNIDKMDEIMKYPGTRCMELILTGDSDDGDKRINFQVDEQVYAVSKKGIAWH